MTRTPSRSLQALCIRLEDAFSIQNLSPFGDSFSQRQDEDQAENDDQFGEKEDEGYGRVILGVLGGEFGGPGKDGEGGFGPGGGKGDEKGGGKEMGDLFSGRVVRGWE